MLKKFTQGFILSCLLSISALAQVQITYPLSRIVLQRSNANQANVAVAGNFSVCVDKIEARATPMVAGQGVAKDWTVIQNNPQGGIFSGTLTLQGGWYQLEVRGSLAGNIVGSASVSRIGVGEVFVIAGQSNASGVPQTDIVGANDDRVSCVNYFNTSGTQNDPPIPVYSHLDAFNEPALRGLSAWSWGYLGDYLTNRLNVPVMFFNAGWGSTAIRNWKAGAQDSNALTANIYSGINYPPGMPYANLRILLNYYISQTGVRSVLWHQGENDAHLALANSPLATYITKDDYIQDLKFIISKTRQQSGKNLSWVVARASLHNGSLTSQLIIDAQTEAINTTSNTFAGPSTDGIQNPRLDGDHFVGDGHKQHAQAWSLALDDRFFATSTPFPAIAPPVASVSCGSGSTLTLSMPSGYSSYLWSNGATTQSITVAAGTYSAKVKDGNGNTIFSQPFTVVANPQATSPTITSDGSTTVCTGTTLKLTAGNLGSNCSYSWSNGATTPSISVNTAGTYTVTAKNLYGCTASSAPTIITTFATPPPATPTINALGSTTICVGKTVTLSSNAGANSIWSSGQTGQSINISASGSFTVRAVDVNGCSSQPSQPITITTSTAPTKPTITPSGATSFCIGNQITLSTNYLSGIRWNTAQTTNVINVTSSGKFSVQYTDPSGCVSAPSDTLLVTANPLPPAPVINSSRPTTFCQGSDVLLSSSPAAAYVWSSGENTQNIRASNAGSYSLYIFDTNGCKSPTSSPTIVSINPLPPAPTIVAGGFTTICPGASVSLSSSSGTNTIWSNGQTGQGINANATASFSARATDVNGCASLPSNIINVLLSPLPAKPIITASGPTAFCVGGQITLSANYNGNLKWSTTEVLKTITVSTSGKYTVQFTDTNGCPSPLSDTTIVVVNPLPPAPTITTNGTTTICQGSELTLNATQAASYTWSSGQNTPSIKVTNPGSYSVSIVDANGCKSPISSPITLTVNPIPATPTITAAGAITFCPDKNVDITSSTGLSYKWSNLATTKTINTNKSGTYTVQVGDINSCFSLPSNPIIVNVFPVPVIPTITASGPLSFCEGGAVKLISNVANAYSWSNGSELRELNLNQSGVFSLKTTDLNGCVSQSSANTTITVFKNPSKPVITPEGPSAFCLGGSVILTTQPQANYEWSNGGKSQKITITATGKYAVKITDVNGCISTASDSIAVSVSSLPPKPTITADGPTTFCEGRSVILTSSAETGYRWSNGATTQSITVSSPGNYSLRSLNSSGCASPLSESITTSTNIAPPPPTVTSQGSLIFCDGGSALLCANSTTPNFTTKWSNNETTTCITAKKAGEYTAYVIDSKGCNSISSNSVKIITQVLPSVPVINQIGTYTLEAQGAIKGEEYRWDLDGAEQAALKGSIIKVAKEGSYTVKTRLTYTFGTTLIQCFSSASDPFKFNYSTKDAGVELYPNPNSTGIFTVESREDLSNAEVIVYSVLGHELYRTQIQSLNERKTLDLSNLPIELYIVKIKTATGFNASKKIYIVK